MADSRSRPAGEAPGPVGVAAGLSHMGPEERRDRFVTLPEPLRVDVFQWLDAAYQQELVSGMTPSEAQPLVQALEPDDRAKLIDQLPKELAERVMGELSERDRWQTQLLLEYPSETAGHIMSPNFLPLAPDMTVAQAIERVRMQGREAETAYVLPVLEEEQRLAGVVGLRALVLADPNERLADLMDRDVHTVEVWDDRERVARLIMAADLLAVPVLGAGGRVLGLVTVDDAMDVLSLEEAEDLARTGAAEPLERPYFSASVFKLARTRVIWLLVLVVAATLTVNVLSLFEATLDQIVSLALFIPLLIGTGGNAGAQAATTIVRAMATDEVRPGDVLRVASRELLTGAILGAMLGALAVTPVGALFGRDIGFVIALSLLAICALAALVGAVMPLAARRAGVDPAVVSAPFVTTIVDATGLLVYFSIAKAIIRV